MTLVHWFFIPSVMCHHFITGRNEVVAKVMFLQVCVCPQGGCLPQCMLGCQTPPDQADPPMTRQTRPPRPGRYPPRTRQTLPPLGPGRPPGSGRPPQDQADPLGPGRHPPGPGRHPRDQADTPRTRQTPPRKQTPAYSLRAAGTHPTGMHSCLVMVPLHLECPKKNNT